MNITNLELDENELREMFELLSTCTEDELIKLYSKENYQHIKQLDLNITYNLNQSKRDFSMDAWRAVLYFLNDKGYSLINKDGKKLNLDVIKQHFL